MMESFFGIKNFTAVMVSFFSRVTKSLFSGQASLTFHMMHKFPGTTFFQFSLNFFDYNNILIFMKKDVEHISVNTVRANFPLHK